MRKTSEQRFYARTDISQKNKDIVTRFFKSYNCEPTTREKFFSFFPYTLTRTQDISKTMFDGDELATIFDELHSKYSSSVYKICVDNLHSLARQMNKGEIPDSFKQIKKLTDKEKERLKRHTKPGYKTLTWEDGLKMIDLTNSVQIKALIMCQLDAGFRPGELERLNYGDVRKDKKFIICHVAESKTAEQRDVILYRSAAFISRWLQMHPTKKANDPLWLMEHRTEHKLVRYTYDAIRQLIRRLGIAASLGTVSLYMMRHSAVALSKQERMDIELASEKFGHDINYYISTYGKLTPEQKVNRVKAFYGEQTEDKKEKPNLLCPVCDEINEPDRTHCLKCNSPLSLEVALKEKEQSKKELTEQFKSLFLQQLINPEFKKEIARYLEISKK